MIMPQNIRSGNLTGVFIVNNTGLKLRQHKIRLYRTARFWRPRRFGHRSVSLNGLKMKAAHGVMRDQPHLVAVPFLVQPE